LLLAARNVLLCYSLDYKNHLLIRSKDHGKKNQYSRHKVSSEI
jgi:hypothetical protein